MYRTIGMIGVCVLLASPAQANKLIKPEPQEKVAKGAYSAHPETTWNRLSEKEGKFQEIWTLDGDQLNRVIFFGGVPVGEPLLKERDKKNDPLPKVGGNMLLPDIPAFFERSYRSYYGTPTMRIGLQEPASFAGMDGIHFEYLFVDVSDEVERKGEAFAAMHDDKLYLVTFEAPSLYFFERDVDKYRSLVTSLRLRD
ncbi:MAG: hypothetical protein SXG53_24905 [Pseudomonadota bacterium]|nr:hypothetical protein [Pseudomonadota bacterium]